MACVCYIIVWHSHIVCLDRKTVVYGYCFLRGCKMVVYPVLLHGRKWLCMASASYMMVSGCGCVLLALVIGIGRKMVVHVWPVSGEWS